MRGYDVRMLIYEIESNKVSSFLGIDLMSLINFKECNTVY